MTLDEIDKRILGELQLDAKLQNIELAKRVGLSPSPCLRRVKLLEEAGIISRYIAVVDQSKAKFNAIKQEFDRDRQQLLSYEHDIGAQ